MGKILFKVEVRISNEFQVFSPRVHGCQKSYTMGIWFPHSFFVFLWNTKKNMWVVLNFIRQQHPSRLFLWLPRVQNSTQFLLQRRNFVKWFLHTWDPYFRSQSGVSDRGCLFFCTLEFQIHLLPFLSSRLPSCRMPSCRMPSCWMDGMHAICLSTNEKVDTESLRRGHRMPHRSSSRFLIGQFFIIYVTMWSGHTPTLSADPFPTQGDGVNGMACRECALAFACNQSLFILSIYFCFFSLYGGFDVSRPRAWRWFAAVSLLGNV